MNIDWKNINVKIISGGRGRWRKNVLADSTWSGHTADNDLWVVWAGEGHMETHSGRVALQPGTVLWMKPGFVYRTEQDPKNTLGMDFIHFELLDNDGKNVNVTNEAIPELLMAFDSFFVQSMTRHIVELLYFENMKNIRTYDLKPGLYANSISVYSTEADKWSSESMNTAAVLMKSLLIDLDNFNSLDNSLAQSGTTLHHRWIAMKASMFMRENTGTFIEIEELAKRAGYSLDHFTRIFKTIFGVSPQEYLIDIRIKKAEQLLSATDLNISQIASDLGYCDKYFFSKQFKKRTGLSPKEFRTKNRNNFSSIP